MPNAGNAVKGSLRPRLGHVREGKDYWVNHAEGSWFHQRLIDRGKQKGVKALLNFLTSNHV